MTSTGTGDEIADSIKLLGSGNFKEREAALQKLWNSGQASVEALKAAVASDDPELSGRASFVLRRITLHLTPESPPEVLQLVEGYEKLDPGRRKSVLKKLSETEATYAFLKLWSEEEDYDVRETLREKAEQALGASLESLLANGDLKGVGKLLAGFPLDAHTARKMAEVYQLTGELEGKIASLENSELESEQEILLLACYRRAGNLEKALALAIKLQDKEALATLSLLAGNGEPYLRWRENFNNLPDGQEVGYQIVRAQLEGREDDALELVQQQIRDLEEVKSTTEKNRIYRSLLATGCFDLIHDTMVEENASFLVGHYRSTLNTRGYLGQYDYPENEEERREWQDLRIRKIIEENDYNSQLAGAIFYLSARYHRFGDLETASGLIEPLKSASKEAGEEHWKNFLKRAPTYVRYPLLIETIEDDWEASDYLGLLESFYANPSANKARLWNLLVKQGELTPRECFDEMAIFYDWIPQTPEEQAAGWRRMIERGKKDEELLELVIQTGLDREPLLMMKEAVEIRAKQFEILTRKQQWETVRVFVRLRDWNRATHYLEQMESPEDSSPGLMAGILKRSGREEEALVVLDKSHGKVLADPKQLYSMALDLELAGCAEEASTVRFRIAMESPPSSPIWRQNLIWMLDKAGKENDRGRARAVSLAMVADEIASTSYYPSTETLAAHLRLQYYRGLDLIDAGKGDEGRAMIEKALNPLVGSFHVTGVIVENLDQEKYPELTDLVFQSSYQRFNKAIEDFPRYATARNGQAWLCALTKRHLEEAKKHSETSIEIYPSASYCDTLALLHRHLGNREQELHWQEYAVKEAKTTSSGGTSILSRYDWILENP